MDPITAVKLWTVIKPIKRFKNWRAKRKARKAAEEDGLDWQPEEYTDSEVEAEMGEFIKRKAKGAVKSTTIGVAGLLVALGGWVQANPTVLSAIVPDGYGGVALAGVGLIVAIARLRTAGE